MKYQLSREKMAKKWMPTIGLLTLGLFLGQPSFANNDTILRVCADPGNMPISNDKGEGFSNKIAKIIAEGMGKSGDLLLPTLFKPRVDAPNF